MILRRNSISPQNKRTGFSFELIQNLRTRKTSTTNDSEDEEPRMQRNQKPIYSFTIIKSSDVKENLSYLILKLFIKEKVGHDARACPDSPGLVPDNSKQSPPLWLESDRLVFEPIKPFDRHFWDHRSLEWCKRSWSSRLEFHSTRKAFPAHFRTAASMKPQKHFWREKFS